jgi:uncharacterized RDD family membrane protein YckC
MPTAGGARRLLAFAVDYGVIAGYIALLTFVSLTAQRATGWELRPPSTPNDRLLGHALGFATLTAPVILYFAFSEASRAGATLGKRALRLRVVGEDDGRVSLGRALVRAGVKFLPWELAHATLWQTPGWPTDPQPGAAQWMGFGLSLALAAWYLAAIFIGTQRPLYDLLARTRVVTSRRHQPPLTPAGDDDAARS